MIATRPVAALLFQSRCNRSPGASSCEHTVQKVQHSNSPWYLDAGHFLQKLYSIYLGQNNINRWESQWTCICPASFYILWMEGTAVRSCPKDQSPVLNHWSWRSMSMLYLMFIERLMEPFSADIVSVVDWYSLSVTRQPEVKASAYTWGLGISILHQTNR